MEEENIMRWEKTKKKKLLIIHANKQLFFSHLIRMIHSVMEAEFRTEKTSTDGCDYMTEKWNLCNFEFNRSIEERMEEHETSQKEAFYSLMERNQDQFSRNQS